MRVPIAGLREGKMLIEPEAAHYLTRVHRLSVGQRFLGFDPEQASHAEGEIVDVQRSTRQGSLTVHCEFGAPRQVALERRCSVQLLQGLGKADKPDRIVRAATELGATQVFFVRTARSVVSLEDRAHSRLLRLKAVAIEAARQSGRADLPTLGYFSDLPQALQSLDRAKAAGEPGRRVELLLDAGGRPLPELVQRTTSAVTVLIGPEGGFSPEERELALHHGFVACRMGDYVLRTETAAIAAVGAVVATLQQ